MAKVTQSPRLHRPPAPKSSTPPAVSPRLIEEAARVFLALGITSADLRLRARPGSAFAQLADALDAGAGAP
jgi:hypothetical protein